ncbi:MAG: hypothetical protein ACLRIL_07965 [Fusicatenibacter saccharivorans]
MSADMSDMEYDADDMTEDIQDDSFDLDEEIWDDNADLAEDDRMDLSANDSEWDLEEPDLEELRDPTIGEADLAVVREMEESGEFDEVLPSDLGECQDRRKQQPDGRDSYRYAVKFISQLFRRGVSGADTDAGRWTQHAYSRRAS